ncbi:MAG: 6-bladed beta-propeller [Nitrosopumilus sp. D6]|nr:MAG: 6-bladed beta-propeller [Nitrosopumilus sp. D6]
MFFEFVQHKELNLALIVAFSLAVLAGSLVPDASGKEYYKAIGEWGSFGINEPEHFSHPQYVAVDEDGSIYVSDLGNKRIQKFSDFGQYITEWGSSGKGSGGFHYPAGVAAYNGSIFVADHDLNRIQKFSTNGTFVLEWGMRGSNEGQFLLPNDIAIHDGLVYVVDTGNQRVQTFTTNGEFVSVLGSSGLGEGQFLTPLGIDVDSYGDIYVADRGNSKIAKFSSNGSLVKSFPFHYYGYDFRPVSITIDPNGDMYILNSATGRIMHLSQDSDLLVGIHQQQGPYRTTFDATDLAMGINGELFVTDSSSHTLRLFETPFYVEPVIVPPEDLTEEELEIFYDTTRPEITAPGSIRAEAEDYRTVVNIGIANATDASGIMRVMNTAPAAFKPGDTTVVWSALDNAGYSATAEQTVTVFVCGSHVSLYNVIRGTDENDVIRGTDADDLIFGMQGNDLIIGGGGNDCIFGGHGDDIISGGDGDDTIRGNSDNDVLKGEAGEDTIYSEGYDVVDGGNGDDVCHSEGNNDVLFGCE